VNRWGFQRLNSPLSQSTGGTIEAPIDIFTVSAAFYGAVGPAFGKVIVRDDIIRTRCHGTCGDTGKDGMGKGFRQFHWRMGFA
jgi:hypothetical protein